MTRKKGSIEGEFKEVALEVAAEQERVDGIVEVIKEVDRATEMGENEVSAARNETITDACTREFRKAKGLEAQAENRESPVPDPDVPQPFHGKPGDIQYTRFEATDPKGGPGTPVIGVYLPECRFILPDSPDSTVDLWPPSDLELLTIDLRGTLEQGIKRIVDGWVEKKRRQYASVQPAQPPEPEAPRIVVP